MSSMILWECEYTLTGPHYVDRVVDFWSSTTPIRIDTAISLWEKIHPGYYAVSDFTVKRAELKEGESPTSKLLERVYLS